MTAVYYKQDVMLLNTGLSFQTKQSIQIVCTVPIAKFQDKLTSSLLTVTLSRSNVNIILPEYNTLVKTFTCLTYIAAGTEQLNNTKHSFATSYR